MPISIFSSLHFVDVNNGYLISDLGLVQKSTNSGLTWQQVSNLNISNVYKIYFVNSLTGFILRKRINNGSVIYRTIDGGNNWNIAIEDSNNTFSGFQFVSSQVGYAIGNNNTILKVLKTTNSGQTWQNIQQSIYCDVRGISFVDANTGFVYGNSLYLNKTTNGCQSFNQLTVGSFYNIDFLNYNTGYAISTSNIRRTTNGGVNWVNAGDHFSLSISDIDFTDINTGIITGEGIINTTNGGQNWNTISYNHASWLWAVDFVDANTGYAGGAAILKTTNGGTNWIMLPSDSGNSSFQCIDFVNANTGYAAQFDQLKKTTNGGQNWVILNLGTYDFIINEIQFVNDYTGFVLAKYSNAYKTTNSGVNWTLLSGYGFGYQECLYFYNANLGFIGRRMAFSGSGVICRTTNGGINWDTTLFLNTNSPYDFYFVNNTTGFVTFWADGISAFILKTTNAGQNWFESYSSATGEVTSLFFSSQNTGYGTLGSGKILKTTNSGMTWNMFQSVTVNFLSESFFINDLTGFVVGNNSTILKTTTGGMPIGISPVNSEIPKSYSLHQNYPNLFNPVTKIKFEIPSVGQRHAFDVQVIIYDILGREITILVNEQLNPGVYEVEWDGTNYPSGVYFYQLRVVETSRRDVSTETKKMVLLK